MLDRESAITHLQIIHTWAEFAREHDLQFFTAKHLEDIVQWTDDALELLKEQEPEKVFQMKDRSIINETHGKTGFCPRCNQVVVWEINRRYCGFCGKELIWDA